MSETATPGGETPTTGTQTPATATTGTTSTQPNTAPATGETTNPTTGETLDGEEFDAKRAMALITKLRQEAKEAVKATKELETLREEKRQAELAKLSEQERLTKRVEEAERRIQETQRQQQERVNRYEVQLQASRLGIVDPDAAVKLLDWSSLEYAADGTPRDVEAALKQLVADRPYLAGQSAQQTGQQQAQQPQPSATNGATRTPAPGSRVYTAAELGDREFYVAHRDDINRAFREGRIRG